MSGWCEYELGQLGAQEPNAFATGPFGSSISAKYFVDEGIPVIRGSNLSLEVGRRLVEDSFAFLAPDKAAEFRRNVARRGDLVFTCWGTIGQIGYIGDGSRFSEYVISNKQMKMTPDASRVDGLFLYYLLSSPQMLAAVQRQQIGTSVPGFNLGQLRGLGVRLPSLEVQRRIASALSAFDDLIENSTRRIEILEEIAKAIYREWFVNFRYPGHENVPLVDSELGSIPEGWAWSCLGEIASELRLGVDPRSVESETPYVGLEHMPEGSIALDVWGRAAEAGSRKYRFERGDVLFGKIRPYFHKVVVAPVDGICSTDAIVIRPRRPDLFGMTVGTVSSVPFVAHAVQTSQGTKMPRANWGVLERYAVPEPPQQLLARFNDYMVDFVSLIHSLVATSRSLRATRDLLLPRLISGEVDVSELDIDVGELVS